MARSGIVRLSAGTRAQAGPIGYVVLLGMILMGTTAIVTIGGAALTDTQDRADIQRTEKSMTLFDSRAAMVALGEARSSR